MTLDDLLYLWTITVPALLIVALLALTFAHLALRRHVRALIEDMREYRTHCLRDVYDNFGWKGRCVRTDPHHPDDCRAHELGEDDKPAR